MSRNDLIFGLSLLSVYLLIALSIALGKVLKDTSYGLDAVLIGLTGVGTAWATGVFRRIEDKDKGGT